MERKTVISGTMRDSSGKLWGQNPEVTLGLVATVAADSGISINSKVLANESVDFLSLYDHGTWDFACPLGLQKYGINLGLVQSMAKSWSERAQRIYSNPSQVHLAFSPAPSIQMRDDHNGIHLSIAMSHHIASKILERFARSISAQFFPSDNAASFGQILFSTLRHPLAFYGEGAPHLVLHFKSRSTSPILIDNHPYPAGESSLSQLLSEITYAVSSVDPGQGVFSILNSIWSQVVPDLMGALILNGIEIYSSEGFSLVQWSNGQCQVEFRVGFNATHSLGLAHLGSDGNRQIFGPCSDHPEHGHRWGLRIRFQLGFLKPNIESQIPALQILVHDLWQILHGAHLNALVAEVMSAPATSEGILIFIQSYIAKRTINEVSVELHETPKNAFYLESKFAH